MRNIRALGRCATKSALLFVLVAPSVATASPIGYQYYLYVNTAATNASSSEEHLFSTIGAATAVDSLSNVGTSAFTAGSDGFFANGIAVVSGDGGRLAAYSFADAHDCLSSTCLGGGAFGEADASLIYFDSITAHSDTIPTGTPVEFTGHLDLAKSVTISESEAEVPCEHHTFLYPGDGSELQIFCQAYITFVDGFGRPQLFLAPSTGGTIDFSAFMQIGQTIDFRIVLGTGVEASSSKSGSDPISGVQGEVDASHTVQLQLLPTRPGYSYSTASGNSFLADIGEEPPGTPAPVPEPASLTLLGLGLAGMAGRRWRQRKRD